MASEIKYLPYLRYFKPYKNPGHNCTNEKMLYLTDIMINEKLATGKIYNIASSKNMYINFTEEYSHLLNTSGL